MQIPMKNSFFNLAMDQASRLGGKHRRILLLKQRVVHRFRVHGYDIPWLELARRNIIALAIDHDMTMTHKLASASTGRQG